MKKLFAFLAVASLSAVAFAAASTTEKSNTEFKFGGSMDETFNMNSNNNFAPNTNTAAATTDTNWLQKTNFHVTANTSDKTMAYVNFIDSAVWGGGTTAAGNFTPGGVYSGTGIANTGSASIQNTVEVSEAWFWWKASDSLSFKSGRQALTLGSGFLISKNEDLPMPYFFDAVMGRWTSDMVDVDFGGSKIMDSGLASNVDNELVAYGLNVGFKFAPDMLKKFDVFAFQLNGDAGALGIPATWSLLNLGAYIKAEVAMLDVAINFVTQSGKMNTSTAINFNGMALDGEVGLNFPEFMKGRLYVGYHMDTGDDSSTATTSEAYIPLFYDVNKYSVSNIWGMGNLSNITAGLSLSPMEDTTVGVELNMASRTTVKQTTAQTTVSAANGNFFTLPGSVDNTQSALGTTIGVWGKHDYGHGFNIMAGVTSIAPGAYYKGGTVAAASGLQGKINASLKF